MQTAIFGGGCFWCTEAVFLLVKGVNAVTPGYTGGHTKNPTYKDICNGNTGHAEVIKIDFDETAISYKELLLIFFKTHDPTTLNRQGNDRGTQYRSVIYYMDAAQKEMATQMVETFNREHTFESPVVTEISPATDFYAAEDEHVNYYNNNQYQPYCAFVIAPKLAKFDANFQNLKK